MVANRQRNRPKREIDTAPPAAMTATPREVTPPPPDFCPSRPAPQTAAVPAASRTDGYPGQDSPGIAIPGQ